MGRSSKKPRKKLDAKRGVVPGSNAPKKEKDWSFDDILRSKTRKYS